MDTAIYVLLGLVVGAVLGAAVAVWAGGRRSRDHRHTEQRVAEALAPVAVSLEQMREQVGRIEVQRAQQHGQISEQLRSTLEAEERIRGTAESLAAALRSNSTRGVWGETQLRSVVEAAGMIERVDFDLQATVDTDSGRGRPDMTVHLPGGKTIAVDAKAPFDAFLQASSIPADADAATLERRDELLRQHVKAVRDHITALGAKGYWTGMEASPEFVIAFIPGESLVSAAHAADPTLMEYAFSRHVALASPVTLWSVLKTVAFSWQQDVLTRDAKRLFDISRELYGRLTTMAGHVEKLGRSLTSSIGHYNRFVGSLEGSVLPSARKLGVLDESKILPDLVGIEDTARPLIAPELTAERSADEAERP